jgi:DNA-binding transcriptional ArsR family regulator
MARELKVIEDVATLKALAHPLRIQLLARLRLDGPATASELARAVEESSGSTSYHLRQLARFDMVEEIEGHDRRERRWRARHEGSSFDTTRFLDDAVGREAAEWLERAELYFAARVAAQWFAERERWPREWTSAATLSDLQLRLPPEALRALTREMLALAEQYERDHGEDPGAERVSIFLQAFPLSDVPGVEGLR